MVTRARDVYRAYYTKSGPIVHYMIEKLSVGSGMKVFEPCAGDGVFIDALNSKIPDLSIDIYELNSEAVPILREKYGINDNIRIVQGDTLTSEELTLLSNAGGIYDRIIANPPYGGWQEYERRKYLKKIYPQFYVRETYTLFLFRCVQLLRDGGILVFIIPDTFLNLHLHKNLREFLLTNTKIKEISLFPSRFFPGGRFGYAHLSIITLQKCTNRSECLKNVFKVITGFKSPNELGSIENHPAFTLSQKEVYENISHALFISENPKITHLINFCERRIGDIASCVTGLYSGNDKKYLHPISPEVKNAKGYEVVDTSLISEDYVSRENILEGIKKPKCFIPIMKGGGIKYFKPDNWYIDWSAEAVKHYKTDKRARFQNSRYYFGCGIGIPMVSSSQTTAALIENKLFDQSTVGIFPKDRRLTYYLLALLNSPTCNKLIRTINPSANNSANYIKKIPFITPPRYLLEKVNRLVEEIVESLKQNAKLSKEKELELDRLIEEIYGF